MDRIEELKENLENYYKEIKAKIEELKKKEPKKRWRSKRHVTYYLIYGNLNVEDTVEVFNNVDNDRYKYRNYFQEREQAEKVAERIKIYMELKDLAEELNGGEKIGWNDIEQDRYIISFDNNDKILRQFLISYTIAIGQIYCLDENFLKKAKERIGEDRLKKLFDEE